ncbi:phosphoenolpyruvate--protein phosphotransferase [Acidocella sp. KAb 2-4]|uniref:phosphoenolpyruvate--protein phosphotransferase n=1 Tax=Acidocella sp. KAb 2-4 TaxID=2885158 RepID=UPI001D06E3E3|nr:phosphoenolpyruvate--protein phosphotransferase [Acidocella sp. KAb 2-4]MCB5944787.1 phosphoenolpyruvate--protein phosphotransferase [Acidocella sp. KAb 2-4]
MKQTRRQEQRFTGHPVSPGIGIGPLHEAAEPELVVATKKLDPAEIAPELARLDDAVARSRHQLQKLKNRLAALPEDSQAEIAPLMDVYLHMLGPSRLLRGIKARVQEALLCAEAAVQAETEAQAEAIMAQTGQERAGRLRRADEVRELGRRLLRNLTRQPFRSFAGLAQGSILAASDLRPSDAALIQPARFAGIVTEEGGVEGHTAVMLRALGLPAVLGAEGVLDAVAPGTMTIIDGDTGEIVLSPSKASLEAARRKLSAQTRARRALAKLQRLPAMTKDGTAVELQANLELPFELAMIAESGAHGIGLLRSEFMFMNRDTAPDEDTQTRIYQDIVEAMDGDPVTIRVLDWGSDKEVEALSRYLPETPEANPALGLRGIRLLLRHPALLETQLAAILRAGAHGPVRILLPMVSVAAEVQATREILQRVWRRLKRRKTIALPESLPPLGIMVETPAAALASPVLAQHADFFSIGTNDLTMYTLAADRSLPADVKLYDPLEPAVLRLIHLTASFAAGAGIPVSLCGELAARPHVAPLLLGLGIRQLSMHGNAVPRVKRAIRATSLSLCERLAGDALAAPSAEAVRAILASAEP